MDNIGWVKIHRELENWEWYKAPSMVHFWIHCLIKANHKSTMWRGQVIDSGQFVTGRKQLCIETGLSEQVVRTCMERLKLTSEITIKTTNKYSIFTINNWGKYQNESSAQPTNNQQITNNQPTNNQQITTNKNDKNEKTGKNEKKTTGDFIFSLKENPEFPHLKNEKFYSLFSEHCELKGVVKTERAITGRLRSIQKFDVNWAIDRIETAIQRNWMGLVFDSDVAQKKIARPMYEDLTKANQNEF